MFFSRQLNLLFIAAPKTGSTSVESFLLKLDPEGERFKITLHDRIVDSSHVRTTSLGHATSLELKDVLGENLYCSMRTFGFVRHPQEKLVSSYFFIRKCKIRRLLKIRHPSRRYELITRQLLVISLARFLPFWLWARVWPMKKCSAYFLDVDGDVNVDFLGLTERLSEDLVGILTDMEVSVLDVRVPHVNRSSHSAVIDYIGDGRFRKYLERRYKVDLALFELAKNGYYKRGP